MSDETDVEHNQYTPEELHDLVIATVAANQPEAMYLADQLEEAGIPVALMSSTVSHSLASDTTLRVPRKSLPRAKQVIEAARTGAHERGVEQAFDPENVEETIDDHTSDPLLRTMFEMRAIEMPARLEQLRPVISAWLLDSADPVAMAKYLAAAGLNHEQSADLVDDVASSIGEEWEETRAQRRNLGASLFIFSIAMMIFIPLISALRNNKQVIVYLGFGPMIAALVLLASSRKKLRTLPRARKAEEKSAN